MNIDDMPAGAELDLLVAERVMGWTKKKDTNGWYWWPKGNKWQQSECRTCGDGYHGETWQPSTNITHAWEVVERLKSINDFANNSIKVEYNHHYNIGGFEPWTCIIDYGTNYTREAKGDTAPLAICRAALKVVMK